MTVRLSQDEANEKLHAIAVQLQADRPGLTYGSAVKEAARLNEAYVLMRDEVEEEVEEPEPVVSLSAQMRSAQSFVEVVHMVQAERKITHLRDAVTAASELRPDLAMKYREDGV